MIEKGKEKGLGGVLRRSVQRTLNGLVWDVQ